MCAYALMCLYISIRLRVCLCAVHNNAFMNMSAYIYVCVCVCLACVCVNGSPKTPNSHRKRRTMVYPLCMHGSNC